MAKCFSCDKETALYLYGKPLCLDCDDKIDSNMALRTAIADVKAEYLLISKKLEVPRGPR
jgi:hypothetical protein